MNYTEGKRHFVDGKTPHDMLVAMQKLAEEFGAKGDDPERSPEPVAAVTVWIYEKTHADHVDASYSVNVSFDKPMDPRWLIGATVVARDHVEKLHAEYVTRLKTEQYTA